MQISGGHIGFKLPANPDVTATLGEAIARINALPAPPAFVLHTGGLTHLSKTKQFDTLNETLKRVRTDRIFYVPGGHDVLEDDVKSFLESPGKGTLGEGW